jgi:hypothetical protein
MNWLRNNDNPADVDDPTAQGWRTLRLPMPGGLSPKRRPSVEDSVNWLRNEVKPEDNELHSYGSDEPRGEPMPKGTLTPTQRRRPLTTR